MSGLVVDTSSCVGCRRCERVCANNGIVVENRKARVLEGCISCGMCVSACPVGALEIKKDFTDGVDPSEFHNIWVFCQLDENGAPLPVALELLAKGRQLATQRNCKLIALLAEPTHSDCARALLAGGAHKVIRTVDARFTHKDAEVFAAWIVELAQAEKPEVILYGATNFGRELAPRVAVLLQTGLTADCTVLEMDCEKGLLQQTRPAFGGNLMATIVCPAHRPQMATVRPGIFAATTPVAVSDAKLDSCLIEKPFENSITSSVSVLEASPANTGSSPTNADVLVIVGRGIGEKKALKQVNQFIDLLSVRLDCPVGLGCTRPVVEAGWLEYAHQVGQTGVSVAPKLLISFGVSGAIQHLAGISNAEAIVAINEDDSAPIFDVAQYKVVGDCHAILSELIAKLEA